jgi:hypothetical protein
VTAPAGAVEFDPGMLTDLANAASASSGASPTQLG